MENLVVTPEMLGVFAVILGALALFALEWFTVDFVAFAIMAALMGLGLVTPQEGIAGFSNPATITVMAMFILSAGLYRTGAIDRLTHWLLRFGGDSEVRQIVLIMLTVGPISAFINNTAAVAILIPFTVKLAREHGRSPSKLLIPLSYTSQLAGVVTLIGTSTNILASSLSQELGFGALGMFEFSLVGLVVLAAGALYLLSAGRWLLPARRVPAEITERFHLKQFLSELVVLDDSPFAGQTLAQLQLASRFDVEVLEIVRDGRHFTTALAERPLQAGDILMILTNAEDLMRLQTERGVALHPETKYSDQDVRGEDTELAEVIVAPGSSLIGATVREVNFRNRYGASVLAMSQHGEVVQQRMADARLGLGDSLLLKAPRRVLLSLKSDPNFIVTEDLRQETHRTHKIPIAVAIIAGVVLLAALGIQPILVAALEGCVLMVLTGCLRIRELHQAIRWDVIFLLAGVIPLGIAMENTGAAAWIAHGVVELTQGWPGVFVLGAFYFVVMVLTGLISNNAAVVLMVPIATGAAVDLGLDPKAFILAVMFAASTSFFTPVGYQTNAMILGPGGYKFFDFTRVGAPLNLLLLFVTTLAIAWIWGL